MKMERQAALLTNGHLTGEVIRTDGARMAPCRAGLA
jgi:hypothetical protein